MDVKDIYTNKWVQIGVASTILVGGGVTAGVLIWKRHKKKQFTIKVKPEDNQLRLALIDPIPRSAPSQEDVRRARYGKEQYDEMRDILKEHDYTESSPVSDGIIGGGDEFVVAVEFSKPVEETIEVIDDIEAPSVDDYETTPAKNESDSVPFNVFKAYGSEWDADAEIASRRRDKPYVIHEDEYIQGESGYKQHTMSYYAGDDVMADHEDTPLYGYETLMGELKFGHGSNDPMVVYIRNDSVKDEWEILLNPGKFAIEVLGHQYEDQEDTSLQHSVQKFRED